MPRLTKEEREQRRKNLQERTLESVAARGQFNFRLDGRDIKRLYEMAGRRQRPVSAMVREWVLERMEMEDTNKCLSPLWAQELRQRLVHTEALLAIVMLDSSHGPQDELTRSKLRDHMLRHYGVESDEELCALVYAQ